MSELGPVAHLHRFTALQDAGVDQFTPASQRVTHCTCAQTGRHLATFTRPESAPCSCRLLSHQTLLWHHRLGHPSLPRLRGMASRVLVSGLPRSLPPLPPGPAPTCVPCIEGRQRAAPHSSEFPPTEAPLQTLHMDVGGEFSSDLLRAFYRAEGICQMFMLSASPQQNGIAERLLLVLLLPSRVLHLSSPSHSYSWSPLCLLLLPTPESRPASPVRTARTSRRVPRPRPPPVPSTHQMALRPSTAPQRVPLPSPPGSSPPALADLASDSLRAASPTVTRLVATVITDPSFESTAPSALVTELVDFAAHCRLNYAASLVAESVSVCPPSVGGECALSMDVLEDRQEEFQCFAAALPHLVSTLLAPEGDPDAPDIPTPRSYAEAIEGPYSSQWQAAMDAEMASWKSTGTYVDEVPPPGANISPVVLTGHADASWVDDLATQRLSQGYTFSLGSGSVSWRSTRSCSVLSSSCEAEIYAGAMAAQELRWLTYLLTDLGEPPRSPPVLYVVNKAMLALCREHRLEHRTKHIALRYFLARELQQRGQLRLAYMASQANTADIFTKALQPCDHQCFCTMLGLVPTWPHLLTS
ncbi:unnamed protein product [Closterium sp. NIES-54]